MCRTVHNDVFHSGTANVTSFPLRFAASMPFQCPRTSPTAFCVVLSDDRPTLAAVIRNVKLEDIVTVPTKDHQPVWCVGGKRNAAIETACVALVPAAIMVRDQALSSLFFLISFCVKVILMHVYPHYWVIRLLGLGGFGSLCSVRYHSHLPNLGFLGSDHFLLRNRRVVCKIAKCSVCWIYEYQDK